MQLTDEVPERCSRQTTRQYWRHPKSLRIFIFSADKMPCCKAIFCKFNVWEIITTEISAKPAGISYDMICAAERMAPKMEYLLLDPQPAINMPKVSTDIIAKK